jgi:hypothetical protein
LGSLRGAAFKKALSKPGEVERMEKALKTAFREGKGAEVK